MASTRHARIVTRIATAGIVWIPVNDIDSRLYTAGVDAVKKVSERKTQNARRTLTVQRLAGKSIRLGVEGRELTMLMFYTFQENAAPVHNSRN